MIVHFTVMGCQGTNIEQRPEVQDELPRIAGVMPDTNDLEDDRTTEKSNIGNQQLLDIHPLKLQIRTQGNDNITFFGFDGAYLSSGIAVDCYDNGSYRKGPDLSCEYTNAGSHQINITIETDYEMFLLRMSSERGLSNFVSVKDWGEFRDGLSLWNLLPAVPNSNNNTCEIDNNINLNVQRPFKLTYQTYKDDVNVKLNVLSVSPYLATYAVDCDGDGIYENKYKGTVSSCHYRKKGKHQIALIGTIPSMRLFDHDDYSLLSIDQWGTNKWQSMHYFMAHTKNAVIKAKDVPDLSDVKDMSEMFSDALKMNSDINNWDVSNVTNMQEMFSGAAAFNRPLNKWNTSNVTNMTKMFANAKKFNQNINNWDVSNVRYMSGMFFKAEKFNQLLDKWDVSNVEYMADMFAYTKYNRPLHNWNIASLLDPCGMFEYSTDDKYIEESIVYYPRDLEFIDKVYERLESIGRECNLRYNHRTDPWRYPQESDYYQFFKDDHDVYPGRF